MAYLVVLEGFNTGKVYELSGIKTIGSAKDNDIVLNDRRVFSHHLSIHSQSSHSILSTHAIHKPVEINGKKITQSHLHQGDIITIGSTLLLFLQDEQKHREKKGGFLPFSFSPCQEQKEDTEIISCVQAEDYKAWGTSKESESLKTLLDINIAIDEIPNLNLLLHQILTIVMKEIKADRGFVIIVKENQKWEVAALYQKNSYCKDISFSYSKAITKKVLTRKMSLLYNPSLDEKGIASSLSCLSVPLHRKSKLLGVIQLESFSGYVFSNQEREQLRKVAQQTAIGIDNLSFYQKPVYYYQQLIALENCSQKFSQHLHYDKILQEAIKGAASLFNSNRVSILLEDEARKCLYIACSSDVPEEKWRGATVSVEKTLEGKVFSKNKPILIHKVKKIKKVLSDSDHSSCCLLSPIPMQGYSKKKSSKAMGVICVTEKKDKLPFTRIDMKLLCFLANQLGIALGNARLYEKATKDDLTQVYSRGYFFQCLQEKILESKHKGNPLSLLMLDIDEFKKINDLYTHQGGDSILKQTGILFKNCLTEKECIGRYGGEEFIIAIPEIHEKAIEKAEEIQHRIRSHTFYLEDKPVSITVSIGVSTLKKEDVCQSFIEKADQALYLAKQKGRNRVVSENDIVLINSFN